MTVSNVSEELLFLRKRARRRLVGAVALVLFALAVLWTVLDNTPPPQFAAGQTVEITSSSPALAPASAPVVAVVEGATASAETAVLPPPSMPAPVSESADVEKLARAENVLSGKLTNHQTQVNVDRTENQQTISKSTAKPTQSSTAKSGPDPRRILEGLDDPKPSDVPKYFLQVGAFSDSAKAAQIVAKLKAHGLPAYSEKVSTAKGKLTRVRVGPSTTEVRVNEWRKKTEAVGVPGKVIRQ